MKLSGLPAPVTVEKLTYCREGKFYFIPQWPTWFVIQFLYVRKFKVCKAINSVKLRRERTSQFHSEVVQVLFEQRQVN